MVQAGTEHLHPTPTREAALHVVAVQHGTGAAAAPARALDLGPDLCTVNPAAPNGVAATVYITDGFDTSALKLADLAARNLQGVCWFR